MRKKTRITGLVMVLLALAAAGAGVALCRQSNTLQPHSYDPEEQRIAMLKESAAPWPDDWADRELLLHPDWTAEEAHAIRRMDTYLRRGSYEAAVAQNEHLKQQVAQGLIVPCPCGFDAPRSDLALKLAHKAYHAPVRLVLLQMAATRQMKAQDRNMALAAAMCREWELARALVRRGCSASTPGTGDSRTLIEHVLYADVPTEELLRFLELFHQRGERIWGDNRDICFTAYRRNEPHKILRHAHGKKVEENFLPAIGGGAAVLEWAYNKGLLTEIEWADALLIADTLPLIQRFLRDGALSLQVTPEQYYPTPVQEAVILAAPPARDGLSMDDLLQKLEWMLENGADPNALPTRYSERGDRRYLPLAMCRRVLSRTDLQDRDAWLRLEQLLLKHGATAQ